MTTRAYWLTVGVLAALSFTATLVGTSPGPGLSPDSVYYVSTGVNLADGMGLTAYTGEVLTTFPPGMPLVVAAGEFVGVGWSWTVRLVQATAFALIVMLSAALMQRHVNSRAIALGATAFVAVSAALLDLSLMAWSEPLFIVVVLSVLLGLERALLEPQRVWWTVMCALGVWVGFALRYAGVALILSGMATLLIGLWSLDRALAMRRAAQFAAVASLVPALWMLRNALVDGTALGPRYPASSPALGTARIAASTVGSWLLPSASPGRLTLLIGVGLVAALVAALALPTIRGGGAALTATRTSPPLLPLAVWVFSYTVYLLLAQLTVAIDPINSRLLSPVLVPLVVLASTVLDQVRSKLPRWTREVAALALLAVIAIQAISFGSAGMSAAEDGRGFNTARWEDSQLAAAVAALPPGATIYSNQPDGVWAATGRQPVEMSPRLRGVTATNQRVELTADFVTNASCSEAYLAWFKSNSRSYLRSPQQLADDVALDPVQEFPGDGTLYRLGPLGEANCA